MRKAVPYANYIAAYWDAITKQEIRVGQWIRSIYKIVMEGVASKEYIFDARKANAAIRFIETFCHHSKGRNDLLKLELWQKAAVSILFGIVDKKGLRVFREVFIVIGRKNGKTLFAAAIMAYIAYIDGEYGTEIYCLAPKLEQADIVYDCFYQMSLNEPELAEATKKRRSDIYIRESNTKIMKLAFNAKKSDGFNPGMVVNDEAASWRGDNGLKQYEVMKSAVGARVEPIIMTITTAGYENDGIYDELMKRATSFLKGNSREKRLLPLIYMIDDAEKWDDIEELKKANPNMGISVPVSFFEDEINIAHESISKRIEVKTKYANIKQNSSMAWLEYEDVMSAMTKHALEDFKDMYAVVGIDLSQTTDLTAATVLIERDGVTYAFTQFFMPRERIEELTAKDGVPYHTFVTKGVLTLTGDNHVDYHDVLDWVMKLRREYQIYVQMIGYDRYSAKYLIDELNQNGFKTDDVYQGENLAPVMREYYGLLKDKKIVHAGDNSLMAAHLLDVAVKHNTETRKFRPVKVAYDAHIDGFVSMIDALTVKQKWHNELGELLKNVA